MRSLAPPASAAATLLCSNFAVHADGLVVKPRSYEGSLEERAQSAMIVFTPGTEEKSAVQELILKIRVENNTRRNIIIPFLSRSLSHQP